LASVEQTEHGGVPARHLDGRPAVGDSAIVQIQVTMVIALMTIQIIGPASNVAQFGLTLLIAAHAWRSMLISLPKLLIFLAYPLLTIASTLWSEVPDVSLRYSTQFAFTAVAGLLIGAAISPRGLVGALYVANLIVVVGSIATPRYGMSEEGVVLIGLTGSKNQIAAVAQIALSSALAVLIDKEQPTWLRRSTPLAAAASIMLLIQAHSATGTVVAIGETMVFGALVLLRPLRPRTRLGLILAALLVMTPLFMVRNTLAAQVQQTSLSLLNKDATLTGRTYLWAQADRLIALRPVLGHGYRAVWLGKSMTTIGLLRWTGLPDGRGFHFHHTYREVTVDTGRVGVSLFILSIALIGVGLLAKSCRT